MHSAGTFPLHIRGHGPGPGGLWGEERGGCYLPSCVLGTVWAHALWMASCPVSCQLLVSALLGQTPPRQWLLGEAQQCGFWPAVCLRLHKLHSELQSWDELQAVPTPLPPSPPPLGAVSATIPDLPASPHLQLGACPDFQAGPASGVVGAGVLLGEAPRRGPCKCW